MPVVIHTARKNAAFTNARSAFTLIELLVVIAIIAVLAAILFPVFAKAREKSRQTACLSNEKQIGLGMLQYLQDYDETYPRAWYGPSNGPSDPVSRYKWHDALMPYVKNEQVYTCPSDDENAPYKFRGGRDYGSYGMNATYWWAGDNYNPPYEQAMASLARPADTIWVLEMANMGLLNNFEVEWAWTGDTPGITDGGSGVRRMRNISERHNGMTNVLWCDGHAKAMKLEALNVRNAAGAAHLFTIEED